MRRSAPRGIETLIGVVVVVLAVLAALADVGGAVSGWRAFVAWLAGRLGLPSGSVVIRHEGWLLVLFVLLAAVLVAWLQVLLRRGRSRSRSPGGRAARWQERGTKTGGSSGPPCSALAPWGRTCP